MKRKLLALLTAVMCVTSVPYTAMAKESGQYAEMKAVNVDIKQDIAEVVYNGDKISCNGFTVSGKTYVQLRQLAEETGKKVSYDSSTKRVVIKNESNAEKSKSSVVGAKTAVSVENMNIYGNDIDYSALKNSEVYNADGYTYCELNSILKLFSEMDKADGIQKQTESFDNDIVEYENDMGNFFTSGKNIVNTLTNDVHKADDAKVDRAIRKSLLKVGNYKVVSDVKTYVKNMKGMEIIIVDFDINYGNGEGISREYIYMPVDGTESEKTIDTTIKGTDIEKMNVNINTVTMDFNHKTYEYKGSAATKGKLDSAKVMSASEYSDYKLLDQWTVPFIYKSYDDDKVYEVIAVENLLEKPDGSKCLKESFYKVTDFIYSGNEI